MSLDVDIPPFAKPLTFGRTFGLFHSGALTNKTAMDYHVEVLV